MTHRATVAVRITLDEQRRLDELSARTGRSRSFYVREAIPEWENSDQSTRPAVELWSELGL